MTSEFAVRAWRQILDPKTWHWHLGVDRRISRPLRPRSCLYLLREESAAESQGGHPSEAESMGLWSVSTANSRRSAVTRCPGHLDLATQGHRWGKQGQVSGTQQSRGPPAKVGSQLGVGVEEEEATTASDAAGSRGSMPQDAQSAAITRSRVCSWLTAAQLYTTAVVGIVKQTESIGLGSICQILKRRKTYRARTRCRDRKIQFRSWFRRKGHHRLIGS